MNIKYLFRFEQIHLKMSDKALREELDQTVDRVLKKLDRKTLVEGFPEVFLFSDTTYIHSNSIFFI